MEHKVLITTSGSGRRLGNLTKYTNSALVRVGKKPAISYIVETYPTDTKFVITVGHFADQVKDFLHMAYPDRNFEFIDVANYDGEGSSLGLSMLAAKESLQCPFIFHASDTIIAEAPPGPDKNWIGVFRGEDASQYASWSEGEDGSLVLLDKGARDFDFIHIGLVGIKDYKAFWHKLGSAHKNNPDDSTLNDCIAIAALLKDGTKFDLEEFATWYDVGNAASLRHAREAIPDSFHNLDKFEEEIFIFEDFAIKFFFNEKTLANRVERARILSGLVPKIEASSKNFYRYTLAKGDLYSRVANAKDFGEFLSWAKGRLWLPHEEVSKSEFKVVCQKFYKDKTIERINKFLSMNFVKDETQIINGEKIPPVLEIIEKIDFNWLTEAKQTGFHGDFILENIIKTKDGYALIDWRQDFGGLLSSGDMYYDLAKLNHNLMVNHDLVDKEHFYVRHKANGDIECEILVKHSLAECRRVLVDFLNKNGYDKKKVGVLTALIWLNMSPLHHHPFNIFLFHFGKYHLWRALNLGALKE